MQNFWNASKGGCWISLQIIGISLKCSTSQNRNLHQDYGYLLKTEMKYCFKNRPFIHFKIWGYFSVWYIHNSISVFWSARTIFEMFPKNRKSFGCSDGIIIVNTELWFMIVMTEKYKILTVLCGKSRTIPVTAQCPSELCPRWFSWSWCSHKAAQEHILKSLPLAHCKPESIISLQRHYVIWPSFTRGCDNPAQNCWFASCPSGDWMPLVW